MFIMYGRTATSSFFGDNTATRTKDPLFVFHCISSAIVRHIENKTRLHHGFCLSCSLTYFFLAQFFLQSLARCSITSVATSSKFPQDQASSSFAIATTVSNLKVTLNTTFNDRNRILVFFHLCISFGTFCTYARRQYPASEWPGCPATQC